MGRGGRVASMLCKGRVQNGVRCFDPGRDLAAVAELIDASFGDALDPAGRAALADMRRVARWGALLRWIVPLDWSGLGAMTGFVWVEGGQVVGNVSLRRSPEWGGFLIGNVAVHPCWQGRGIAGTLMEVALDEIISRSGRWAGLEVEADNRVARRLYSRQGFREVGRVLHMLRPAGLPWNGSSSHHPALRRGRSRDSSALVDLSRAVVQERLRPLLELRKQDYQPNWQRALDQFLEGRRETWWMIKDGGVACAAVRVLRERGRYPDRLEVLVLPEYAGRFENVLVQQAMASLRGASKKAVETLLPDATDWLVAELRTVGFEELRVLVQMRLDFDSISRAF
jgi:ribosomal protein S18 acetylase RimI-like enzyme